MLYKFFILTELIFCNKNGVVFWRDGIFCGGIGGGFVALNFYVDHVHFNCQVNLRWCLINDQSHTH